MGKEHLCLGRGSRQQAAPKWWLKLHPALRVRVCACVCVCVCVGGAAGGRLELQPRPVHCGPGRPGSEAL